MKTQIFSTLATVMLVTLGLVSCGPKVAGTYVGTESYSDGGETYSTRVTLEVEEPNEDDEIEATFVSTDGTHPMSGKMDSEEAIESVRLKVNKPVKSSASQGGQTANQNNNANQNNKKTAKKESKKGSQEQEDDEEQNEEESEEETNDTSNVMANGPSNTNNQGNTSNEKRSCEVVYTGRLKLKGDVIKGTLTASGGPCQREATSRYIEVEREND